MYVFNGILDGHHVIAAMGVDQVDQRGQGRAFAAAGRSGDQDQPLTGLGESGERRRQVQRFECGLPGSRRMLAATVPR